MKTLSIMMAAVVAAVFTVGGCGEKEQKVVEADKLINRRGSKYEANSRIPFTGKVVEYWSDGQMKMEVEFREGQPHGKASSWHKNGQKALVAEWWNGKVHGKQTIWYENGQKMGETEYRKGNEHGRFIGWYKNGRKMLEAEYSDGRKIKTECWDKQGNPMDCDILDNLF
jgi:antitoxin component YwqK of YwqJK toxin-antitoxin module